MCVCVCVCVCEIIFLSLAICLGNVHPLMSGAQTQRFWFNWPLRLSQGRWVFTAPGKYRSATCWGPRSLNRLQMEWLTSWWLYPSLPLVILLGSPGPRGTSLVLPAGLWEAAALARVRSGFRRSRGGRLERPLLPLPRVEHRLARGRASWRACSGGLFSLGSFYYHYSFFHLFLFVGG